MRKYLSISYNLIICVSVSFLFLNLSCTTEEGNQKPDCNIISPVNGASFSSGDTIELTVDTDDVDGRVSELNLFFDDENIANATNSFYKHEWITANVESGEHILKAVAYDNVGAYNSDEIVITINASLPVILTDTIQSITLNSATCTGIIVNNGGNEIIERGVCWSKNQNPTIMDSKTVDNTNSDTFTALITDLQRSTTYYAKVFATNVKGTSYGIQKAFTTYDLADIDGNVYRVVKIGEQTWMAENLKTTKYNDDIEIPYLYDHNELYSGNASGYCWNSDNINNKDEYGALYNWLVVNSNKVCPDGWHVPTKEEWYELVDYLGGYEVAGEKMKATEVTLWGGGATNSSGFTALPGGYIEYYQGASAGNGIGKWWSASSSGDWRAHNIVLDVNTPVIYEQIRKGSMYSVRCVKD